MINISPQMMKFAAAIAFGLIVGLFVLSSLSSNQAELAKPSMMMTGGLGAVREKDDEVVKAVDKIKPILEEKTNTKYESIDVLSYKSQLVAGRNYFVKAKVKPVDGPESIFHLRIYRDLRDNYELTQFQKDKTLEEELKYFQ